MVVLIMITFVFNTKNSNVNVIYDIVNMYQKIKNEIYQNNKDKKINDIFYVLCHLESDNGINMYNEVEDAVGYIQIRPIMVKEVNGILGYNKYTLNDRWSKEKSFEMFKIYQDFVNPNYDETLACRYWNGGRSGNIKSSTNVYVEKYFNLKSKLNT